MFIPLLNIESVCTTSVIFNNNFLVLTEKIPCCYLCNVFLFCSYLNFDTESQTIVDMHLINYFLLEYLSWVFIKIYEKYYKTKRNSKIFITSLQVNLLESSTILNQVTYRSFRAFKTHRFKCLSCFNLH